MSVPQRIAVGMASLAALVAGVFAPAQAAAPVTITLKAPVAIHDVSSWTRFGGSTSANAKVVAVYAIEKRGAYYYTYDAPTCADVPPGACMIALPHWTRHGTTLASAERSNKLVVPTVLNKRTHRWTSTLTGLTKGTLFLRYSARSGTSHSVVSRYSVVLNHR